MDMGNGTRQCRKCKQLNAPGSQFCTKCGAKLKAPKKKFSKSSKSRPKRTARPKPKRQPQPGPVAPVKTQYSTFIIFIVVLVIVIGAGMIFLMPRGDSGDSNETDSGSAKLSSSYNAVLEIESSPAGASVYVDDRARGRTPYREELPAGSYDVRLEHPDFQKKILSVLLEAGGRVVKTVVLDPIYILEIPANPADALIKIDGTFQGKTPLTIEWANPSCDLLIEKDGWSTYSERLELEPGKNVIEYSLESTRVRLSVDSDPSGAQVYLDGKPAGRTPLKEDLAPGEHTIRLQKVGFRTVEETIQVLSDLDRRFALQESEAIQIRISAHPWAEVFVDGKSIGNVPPIKEISITVGPHSFEFVKGEERIVKDHDVKPEPNMLLHMNMETGELREIKGESPDA
jgi:hypothetical protein